MAKAVADWVWCNSRAANGPLLVLLAIADEADKDGNTEMSLAELTRKARLSERAVQGAVRELGRLGELQVVSEGGGRGHRNTYRVLLKGADSAGFETGNGAESAGFGTETGQILRGKNGAESAGFEPPGQAKSQVNHVNGADSAGFGISDMSITSTGRSLVVVKDVPAKPPRPDVEHLCEHLADRIEANGCKRPRVTRKWRDSARLMLDSDGRTEQQVMTAIDWCQDSEFWRANILSMPKLREKYDQLRMQAMRDRKPVAQKSTTDDRVRQAAEAGKRVQEMLNGGS